MSYSIIEYLNLEKFVIIHDLRSAVFIIKIRFEILWKLGRKELGIFSNREIVTFALSCTMYLEIIKDEKKIKVSQRPGETFGIVIWYKDDNHPLRLDRTPRSSSFFLLATQLSSTILHVHIAQPTTGPRCWFRGETRRLSLSLSRNRGPHTREKRISWLGTKRDVDESSKARSFIPRLSLEIKKHIFPI